MIVIKSLESDTIAHKLESPARSRISTMLHLAVVARVEATDAAGGYSYHPNKNLAEPESDWNEVSNQGKQGCTEWTQSGDKQGIIHTP